MISTVVLYFIVIYFHIYSLVLIYVRLGVTLFSKDHNLHFDRLVTPFIEVKDSSRYCKTTPIRSKHRLNLQLLINMRGIILGICVSVSMLGTVWGAGTCGVENIGTSTGNEVYYIDYATKERCTMNMPPLSDEAIDVDSTDGKIINHDFSLIGSLNSSTAIDISKKPLIYNDVCLSGALDGDEDYVDSPKYDFKLTGAVSLSIINVQLRGYPYRCAQTIADNDEDSGGNPGAFIDATVAGAKVVFNHSVVI